MGAWAGTASSTDYLQFRWDPLRRKRLDKETPSTTQPHPALLSLTPMEPCPADPQHPRLIALLPSCRWTGAAK